ncbi:MAG TPA: 30S ribosomal protein S18 [Candidatus Acidoferrum sp.]|jgi:small subunit ribosomal protein S18|nr:30S ribosomal protein S18 [Candidatus Acidoferrum sp.]
MTDANAPQQQAPAAPAATQAASSGGGAPAGAPPQSQGPGGFGGRPGGPRPQGARPPGGPKRGKRNFVRKKKVCRFCVDKIDLIDYKKAEILSPFIQDRGRVLPRRMTGTCARHQRWLTVAIKRAQNIALLPFAAEL